MALNVSTMAATIVTKLQANQGAPVDAGKEAAFAQSLAEAIYDILTAQAQVAMSGGGIDTNGDTLVTNQGSIS